MHAETIRLRICTIVGRTVDERNRFSVGKVGTLTVRKIRGILEKNIKYENQIEILVQHRFCPTTQIWEIEC